MLDARVADGLLRVSVGDVELLRATGEALLSDGRRVSTRDTPTPLRWELQRTDAGPIIRLTLQNAAEFAVGVEQLRPLVVAAGLRELPLARLRIQQTGWQSWSRSHPPAPFAANALSAAPPIRGPELPHRRADSQVEAWLALLVDAADPAGDGLLLGFLSARGQLGTIEVAPTAGGGHSLVVATELEGIELGPGAKLTSEPLLVAVGAPSLVLDGYAAQVAREMTARPVTEVLTGWCSWYQLYTSVSAADVERNLVSLTARRAEVPLRLVQLDDGYQRAVGDWLDLNDKFPNGMHSLVERIRADGFMPGLWLAPFLLSASSRTYARHPDWVVRDRDGRPLNAIDNWGSANYVLDTTHPAAMDWLASVVRTVCADWGFDYLKLDFVYAAAMRGQRHDRQVTGVAAYRRGLEHLRRVAGERFILGCGAPLLPSVGLVDGMRIGSDVAAYWGGGDGNADGPSLHNATRATLARGWMHGRWWANDPDCVVVRAAESELSLAEVQGWLAVVALSGGMVFVGDDVSHVEPERLAMLARLIPPSGQAARVGPPLVGLMPERLDLQVTRPWGTWHVVGIANWRDAHAPAWLDPREFDLSAGEYEIVDLWSGAYLGRTKSRLDLGSLPPHAVRLLSVHPVLDRPHTIGSTGHLLGEAMDLAHESWDVEGRVLTLRPNRRGPPARRAEFLIAEPRGSVRRVPFTAASTEPICVAFA